MDIIGRSYKLITFESSRVKYLICSALVPYTLALSYFVIYGVVILLVGSWLSFTNRYKKRESKLHLSHENVQILLLNILQYSLLNVHL